MKRAIAGVGIVVIASLFVLLVPVVPASAHATNSTGHSCAFIASGCLIYTSDVQGYGSITFRMFGVGGTWFEGHYGLATASNLSVSVVG